MTFARKQAGASGMDLDVLRDEAADILRTIAAGLRTPQSDEERFV